jgi:hypothetical protein
MRVQGHDTFQRAEGVPWSLERASIGDLQVGAPCLGAASIWSAVLLVRRRCTPHLAARCAFYWTAWPAMHRFHVLDSRPLSTVA